MRYLMAPMLSNLGPVSRVRHLPVLVVVLLVAACAATPVASTAPATTPPQAMPSSTTILLTTTTQPGGRILDIPSSTPPAIDGDLTDGEWDGAATLEMSDGAPIRLMHYDETLYLSVEGSELGSVNVVMAIQDEIWILHSSAALGSALYTPGSDQWELARGFSWCCRSGNDTTGRLALLEEEGWQANIGFTGTPGIVEYEIAIPWAGALIAVSSVRSDENTGFWPAELSDEARLQLIGAPPPTRAFNTAEWVLLQTADS